MSDSTRRKIMVLLSLVLALASVALSKLLTKKDSITSQSWQQKVKRGRAGGKVNDPVTYDDLDAAITAVQQYSNMHDVQIAQIDERQKEVIKRLDAFESIKMEAQIDVLKSEIDSMTWWHHAIAGGVLLSLIGVFFNSVLHVKNLKRENGNGKG